MDVEGLLDDLTRLKGGPGARLESRTDGGIVFRNDCTFDVEDGHRAADIVRIPVAGVLHNEPESPTRRLPAGIREWLAGWRQRRDEMRLDPDEREEPGEHEPTQDEDEPQPTRRETILSTYAFKAQGYVTTMRRDGADRSLRSF